MGLPYYVNKYIYIGFCLIGGDTRSVKEPGQVDAPETNERKEYYKTWGVE